MFEVKELTKKFTPTKGIEDISFEAKEGRILGILGRNGAGKSTLFRAVLGLIDKDKGTAKLNGKNINFDISDKIGYLIEEGSLTQEYTVYDQFQFFGIVKGLSKDEIEESLLYWLDVFKIREYVNYKIKKLSKGNRQKLQFIVSVLHNPDLLILDEPFSGLDPISVEEIKAVIQKLKEQGKIIIFSSHRLDQVDTLCDDIVLIHDNKMLLNGELNFIKSNIDKKKINIVAKSFNKDLLKSEFIYNISNEKTDSYTIFVSGNDNINDVLKEINEQEVSYISVEELSLEDIFKLKAGESYE